jgi:hypothetical protein
MTSASIQHVTSASERLNINPAAEQLSVLRELLNGGEILPSQLPSPSNWGPELVLAAAVMAQAMADVRLRRRDGRDHIQVSSALRWIRSDDTKWPLSFRRVCELLDLDPGWVRQNVRRWLDTSANQGRHTPLKHAA